MGANGTMMESVPADLLPVSIDNHAYMFWVETVTPQLAERWLSTMGKNRSVSRLTVSKYADDMANGRWIFDGSPIRFSGTETDSLIDGQHRLTAIIQSGATVPMLVMLGAPTDSIDVMDTGRKRSPGSTLELHGYHNYNTVAAVSRLAMSWLAGEIQTAASTAQSKSNIAVRQFAESDPFIVACAQYARGATKLIPGSSTAGLGFGAWLIATAEGNLESSFNFLNDICDMALPTDGDPRRAAARRLASMQAEGRKSNAVEQGYCIARAYVSWRDGTRLEIIRLRASNGNPPAFPLQPDE